tara:strand:+ start:2190 stop:3674 length:1485 start_codon:yes stop_codon:yes gene_type:complete
MINWPILSATIFFPLVGAFIIIFIKDNESNFGNNIKFSALFTSIGTFILSIFLWLNFDPSIPGYQFEEKKQWIFNFNFFYHVGVDGISLFMIILSTFLTPICILSSWNNIKFRIKEYMIAFLILECLMIGMFSCVDLLLFYIFFESVLIPMFLIIGIWGGKRRVYASFKFFLFTLLGSVLMLLAVIFIYQITGTMNIAKLQMYNLSKSVQVILWIAFFASFAIKIPMWPFHTWLPDAHVEAPTAGSVILAGVLLKMGAYGFIRFSLGILPIASHIFSPLIFLLSIIAIIYTSLVALAQTDIKKLVAYSSVAHMGIVTVGIFIANQQSIEGAIIQMLSHGIVSAALFLCVGVLYDRMKTREISFYGGLVQKMPMFASLLMIFTLASIGLPGTSGFVGEFLIILGAFKKSFLIAFFSATGIVLGAVYMLYLYKRIIFGTIVNPKLEKILDLSIREISILLPMAIIVIWIGIFPNSFLEPMHLSVQQIAERYEMVNK